MKWKGRELTDLSIDDLKSAYTNLDIMWTNYQAKRVDPRFIEKMKSQSLPTANPLFIDLRNQVEEEMKRRNVK